MHGVGRVGWALSLWNDWLLFLVMWMASVHTPNAIDKH